MSLQNFCGLICDKKWMNVKKWKKRIISQDSYLLLDFSKTVNVTGCLNLSVVAYRSGWEPFFCLTAQIRALMPLNAAGRVSPFVSHINTRNGFSGDFPHLKSSHCLCSTVNQLTLLLCGWFLHPRRGKLTMILQITLFFKKRKLSEVNSFMKSHTFFYCARG